MLTAYKFYAVDELDLFGCIQMKMSEGGIGNKRETLQVFNGLHKPGGEEAQ